MNKFVVVILLCLSPLSILHANNGLFIGAGFALISYDDEIEAIEPFNLDARIGYSVNPYVDFGLEYNFTFDPDTSAGIDLELSTIFLFVKGNLPIGDRSKIYLMAGPTKVRLTSSTDLDSTAADDSGTGVGLGFQYLTEADVIITFEYIKYYDDTQYDGLSFNTDIVVDSINFGFVRYF